MCGRHKGCHGVIVSHIIFVVGFYESPRAFGAPFEGSGMKKGGSVLVFPVRERNITAQELLQRNCVGHIYSPVIKSVAEPVYDFGIATVVNEILDEFELRISGIGRWLMGENIEENCGPGVIPFVLVD